MRRKPFCCDASRGMYEDYYARQGGGAMPVFMGARYQRGHGLGSMLSGLFRRVIFPFIKNNARTVASHALKTGLKVADDVVEGKSLKESVKQHLPEGIKETAKSINWQTGSGQRKRKLHRHKRVKRVRDIFG